MDERPLPERALWTAVLLALVHDLLAPGNGRDSYRLHREARRWIGHHPSCDFVLVCHLAGIEPEVMHAQLLSWLEQHPYGPL